MSFDLGVWHSDLAISDKEAHKIYRRLGRDPHVLRGKSDAIEGFYSELTARWPEVDTISGDKRDDAEYCPWKCALEKSAMCVITNSVWSDEVFEFVHDLASKHGLVFFDPQAGKVYLPPHLKPKLSRPWFRFW